MNQKIIVTSVTLLLICSAMSCKYVMPERYVDYNKGRVPVNLPRDLKYSEADHDVDKPNAAVITVTADGRRYLGTDHSPIEDRELRPRIQALLEQQSGTDRVVFLAADTGADYGHIISACDEIRMTGADRIGLLVTRIRDDWPSRLTVDVLSPPDPNEDITNLRPNPLTLLVAISPDLSLTLNTDAIGSVNDLAPLSRKLLDIFRQRQDTYALRPGYETRTDLPMSERVEATVIIKAPKRIKYGDVVKVIDAVKGAGARPIILQLDDLPD